MKYAQDLYRARGTAIATRFLVQAITGEEKTEVYHPKVDILKASDGKWFKQKSLRVRNIMVDGQSNTALSGLQKFVGRTLTGNNSNASATVESVNRFYETGILISEILYQRYMEHLKDLNQSFPIIPKTAQPKVYQQMFIILMSIRSTSKPLAPVMKPERSFP